MSKHWKYPDDIVTVQLEGLAASNPAIALIPSEKVVFNPHSDTSKKVTLISGGGAGHEPLHGGFVGENLLDAAVSGAIFALPSTRQIMAAIRQKSDKKAGTLVIVKNYTGDVLHFGLVVERAKAEGYNVEMIAVADDVAVGREQNKMVGRRGLAGTAIMHKLLGAAASEKSLSELHELGNKINASFATIGASLDRTSVPGKTEEIEFTKPGEAELGLGIHNEPGTKMKIPEITKLVDDMYNLLVGDDKDRHYVDFDLNNDDWVLVVNNIGGQSSLELYAVLHYVIERSPFKRKPSRVLVSDFVTLLSAPGFSITALRLTDLPKEDILRWLDTPTNAPGWKPKIFLQKEWDNHPALVDSPMKDEKPVESDLRIDGSAFRKNIENALAQLTKEEPKITHYDTIVGDGDCGETLVNGANGILKALKDGKFANLDDPVATLSEIMEIVEEKMGGTSGGIYLIYLTALVKQLKHSEGKFSVQSLAKAMHSALYDGLFKYTKARVGGRTLVDTLQPFVDKLYENPDLDAAYDAAKAGCENTKKLQAKFGRASYVDEDQFKDEDGAIPDPGAVGLLAIMKGFLGKN